MAPQRPPNLAGGWFGGLRFAGAVPGQGSRTLVRAKGRSLPAARLA
jgi:hypothetical protein